MSPLTDEQAEKLRHHVDRILAIQLEVDAKNLAVRGVYAELRDAGYDKTAVGKIVAYLRAPVARRAEIDATDHVAVSMPIREWPADLSSLPSLRSLLIKE